MRKFNFSKISLGLTTLTIAAALTACAHDEVARQLDEKVAKEDANLDRQKLSKDVGLTIETAKNLNDKQKTELIKIRSEARLELERLKVESLKLRSVLIKDIISSDYDQREVALIKSKLRQVEDERTTTLFRAVGQANKTMGRWPSERARDRAAWESERMLIELNGSY